MSSRILIVILGSAAFLVACESTYQPARRSTNNGDIDGISRNVTQVQGGAIRDPGAAPPVRPAYVNDR